MYLFVVVTIKRITGEVAFISVNFGMRISCSSIFMPEALFMMFIRDLSKLCGMEVYKTEIKCLNRSCSKGPVK